MISVIFNSLYIVGLTAWVVFWVNKWGAAYTTGSWKPNFVYTVVMLLGGTVVWPLAAIAHHMIAAHEALRSLTHHIIT